MSIKKINIFSLIPPRLGGIDMLVPIFMKIKDEKPNSNIEAFFFEYNSWKQLNRDPFLLNKFNSVVDKITVMPNIKNNIFKKFFIAFFFFKLILRILIHNFPIIFHSYFKKNLKIQIIYFVAKLRNGLVFSHSNVLTIFTKNKKLIKKKDLWRGDGIFCFDEEYVNYLMELGHKNIYVIGYTRLYKTWLKTIRTDGKSFLNREFTSLNLNYEDDILSIFLPSTVPNIFDFEELRDWIKVCVKSVRKELPKINILIKPHPQQSPEMLNFLFKFTNDPKMKITYLHTSLLASVSKVVISCHSSTILDSMSLNIPTILFQKFTNHWTKAHPDGSKFLKLQPLFADDAVKLENSIKKALSNEHITPDIAKILHHKENLDILFKN